MYSGIISKLIPNSTTVLCCKTTCTKRISLSFSECSCINSGCTRVLCFIRNYVPTSILHELEIRTCHRLSFSHCFVLQCILLASLCINPRMIQAKWKSHLLKTNRESLYEVFQSRRAGISNSEEPLSHLIK